MAPKKIIKKGAVEKQAVKKTPATKAKKTDLKPLILEELNKVMDPELNAGIVDIGLIYNLTVSGAKAHIQMTLTSLGCPIGPWFVEQVRDATLRVSGIKDAEVELVYEPAWGPEKMKPELRESILGY